MGSDLAGRIAGAALFLFALALYSFATYPDFYRAEDYELGYQVAGFYWSLVADFTGLGVAESLIYQAGTLIHGLLFFRHGAVPAIYFAPLYHLFDLLGLPFSAPLFRFPTAMLGAISCLLVYAILRRAGVGTGIALAGGLALTLSPLFAAMARGFATMVWVSPVFTTLLAIYALQRLGRGRGSRAFAAFALVNLLLGDDLMYLTVPALLLAYGLRDFDWRFASLGTAVGGLGAALRPLWTPIIVVPTALTVAALIAAAAFALLFGDRFQDTLPLFPQLLATRRHAAGAFGGLVLDRHWLDYPALALGEFSPLFIGLAILAVAVLTRAHGGRRLGFSRSFAVIAGAGFVFLFYLIIQPGKEVGHGYQVYTLVPLVLMLAFAADAAAVTRERLTAALTAAFLVLESASAAAYLFKLPLSVAAPFALQNFGVAKPDFGTKAAGYVTRDIIADALAADPRESISIDVYRDPDQPLPPGSYGGWNLYFSPYLLNAGARQRGDVYARGGGVSPRLRVTVQGERRAGATAPRRPCPALWCAAVVIGPAKADPAIHDIRDGERHLVRLFVSAPSYSGLAPGRHASAALNRRFDAAFRRFDDFFPPRPPARKREITAALLRRLGLRGR